MFQESSIRLFILPRDRERRTWHFRKACRAAGNALRSFLQSYTSYLRSFRLASPIVPGLPTAFGSAHEDGNVMQRLLLKSVLSVICTWYAIRDELAWHVGKLVARARTYKNEIRSHSSRMTTVYSSLMDDTKLHLLTRPQRAGGFLLNKAMWSLFITVRRYASSTHR